MKPITTILIANRGEIALRIMRTCKLMGIKTAAVYSDADANAPHRHFADMSVHIGPSDAAQSYLNIDTIIKAAKEAGAQAIHPGYGFLSENAALAQACTRHDLIFIGPSVHAIDVMGDKAKSKRAMIAAGVPCIAGYQGEGQSDARLIKESKAIGFPLMVKAAAGGGGRGMRLVQTAGDLPSAITAARSEALNAFGSDVLIIERAITAPRHVEIQILADQQGTTLHLGERDCSIQRRNQKIIEEAPCPVLSPEGRAQMGAAAVKAAQAVNYIGAGTVEFLLAPEGDFFFLEMNTRLQVEHPVTEMVYGVDLVAEQIKAAQGRPLRWTQDDIKARGHAIEARIYAEDPQTDFLPSTGPVTLWQPAENVRVDSGIETGGDISQFYDSMVAKIIAHGETREDARLSLRRALEDTGFIGPKNNRDFLLSAIEQDVFIRGKAATNFIAQTYGEAGYQPGPLSGEQIIIGALAQYFLAQESAANTALSLPDELLGWGSMGTLNSVFIYEAEEPQSEPRSVIISSAREGLAAELGGVRYNLSAARVGAAQLELSVNHKKMRVFYAAASPETWPAQISLVTPRRSFTLTNIAGGQPSQQESGGSGTLRAPMYGQLLEIQVSQGDRVKKGDKIAVLEAMKMQHEILAEIDGEVTAIPAKAGTQIAADDIIIEIEEV